MDYIAKLYKHRAEQLQEQVNQLEKLIQDLQEEAPLFTFKKGAQNQPYMSDDELRKQMTWHKTSGLFGAEVAYDKQSQEYRDAKEELDRRAAEAAKKTQDDAAAAAKKKEETERRSAVPTAQETKKAQEVADKTGIPTALPTNVRPGTMSMTDMDGRPIAVQPTPPAPKAAPVSMPRLPSGRGRLFTDPNDNPFGQRSEPSASPSYISPSGGRDLVWVEEVPQKPSVTQPAVPAGAASPRSGRLGMTSMPSSPSAATRGQAATRTPAPTDPQLVGPGYVGSGPGIPDLEQAISGYEEQGLPIPGGPVNRANMTGDRNMPKTSSPAEIASALKIRAEYDAMPADEFNARAAEAGGDYQLSRGGYVQSKYPPKPQPAQAPQQKVKYPWIDKLAKEPAFSRIPQQPKKAPELVQYQSPEWNKLSDAEKAAVVREAIKQGNVSQVMGGLKSEEKGGFLGFGAEKTGRVAAGLPSQAGRGFAYGKTQEQIIDELNKLLQANQ